MKKVFILGALGLRNTLYDGQTMKTRNLLSLLNRHNINVSYYDTQEFHYNKFSIIGMLYGICKSQTVLFLPAQNSLRYLFPVLFVFSRILHIKIHYFVVGGWLKEFLDNFPVISKKLSMISGIHCETRLMRDLLIEKYGYKNVDVFPNFRITAFQPSIHHEEGHLRIVFEARINKMKGLDTIFMMGEKILENGLDNAITLDFYGQIQSDDDKTFFDEGISRFHFMKYLGPLEPELINETLEQYDVMVLPTHYYTEGLPGSVLDAYISGIPVIVTNWKHATEFIDDGKTGYITPFDDNGEELYNRVLLLLNNPDLLEKMKHNARSRWLDYSAEKAWSLMKAYLYI